MCSIDYFQIVVKNNSQPTADISNPWYYVWLLVEDGPQLTHNQQLTPATLDTTSGRWLKDWRCWSAAAQGRRILPISVLQVKVQTIYETSTVPAHGFCTILHLPVQKYKSITKYQRFRDLSFVFCRPGCHESTNDLRSINGFNLCRLYFGISCIVTRGGCRCVHLQLRISQPPQTLQQPFP